MQKKQLNIGDIANDVRKNETYEKKNGSKKVMGKRKKLDMDKDGKLTKRDFAMLRNKKKKV